MVPLVAIALSAYTLVIRNLAAPAHHFPLAALVVLFGLAEVFVVRSDLPGSARSFYLVEIPLVLGLLGTRPELLIPAHLLGATVALVLYRRQRPSQLVANLAVFFTEDVAAVVVFYAMAGPRHLVALDTLGAAFVACVVASLVGRLILVAAIPLPEGAAGAPGRLRSLVFALSISAVTSSLCLAGVVVFESNRSVIWLLAPCSVAAVLALRAAGRGPLAEERLRFLYRATADIHADATDRVVRSLVQVRDVFRADLAALAYLPAGATTTVALAAVGSGGQRPLRVVARDPSWEELVASVPGPGGRILKGPGLDALVGLMADDPAPGAAGRASGRPSREFMVVPLRGEEHLIGYLLVGNHMGDPSALSSEDLQLLETFEHFLSPDLTRGRLEESLQRGRLQERQLLYRATHDPLTGLANRTLFSDSLASQLGRPDCAPGELGVILLDLDDPTSTNESLGHDLGDKLLSIFAQRICRCLRDTDVAARVGHRALAILVDTTQDHDAAVHVAHRIFGTLNSNVAVNGFTTKVSVSAGLVHNVTGDNADTLFAAADRAICAARARGNGRMEIRWHPDEAI